MVAAVLPTLKAGTPVLSQSLTIHRPESEIAGDEFHAQLRELLGDAEQRAAMAERARNLAVPDATQLVVRHCLELADA